MIASSISLDYIPTLSVNFLLTLVDNEEFGDIDMSDFLEPSVSAFAELLSETEKMKVKLELNFLTWDSQENISHSVRSFVLFCRQAPFKCTSYSYADHSRYGILQVYKIISKNDKIGKFEKNVYFVTYLSRYFPLLTGRFGMSSWVILKKSKPRSCRVNSIPGMRNLVMRTRTMDGRNWIIDRVH